MWPACLNVTPREIRLFGPLMQLHYLPKRLFGGAKVQPAADKTFFASFKDEGFVMVRQDDEPAQGRAVALFGAVGRFWSVTANAPMTFEDVESFVEFNEPGWAKIGARLEAIDLGNGTTRIETETLVAGTDSKSSRKFAPYWAIIRGPSGLIRRSWLAAIDRRAHNELGIETNEVMCS